MKRALTIFLTAASVAAQSSTDGTIVFKTIGIQNAAGAGTYNVPLFANNWDNVVGNFYVGNGNSSTPAGLVPGGVTVGLFLSSNLNAPLATGQLGTASAAQQPYIITPAPSQTVYVPGQTPGATPSLTIRAWTTSSGSFSAAQRYGGQWGEWVITSKPLGGIPDGGGTPITPPSLTGWGNENGSGFELNLTDAPEPTTIVLAVLGVGALALARRRK
jgi:hypothetical protein